LRFASQNNEDLGEFDSLFELQSNPWNKVFSPGVRDIDGEVVTDELRPAEEFPRPESKDMASPKYCAISSAVKFVFESGLKENVPSLPNSENSRFVGL
jgi:hypothetical protein